MDRQLKWILPEPAKLRWKRWGDESILFDPNTGDTHLLDPLAFCVLDEIKSLARSADELVAILFGEKCPDEPTETLTAICTTLSALETKMLVVRVTE